MQAYIPDCDFYNEFLDLKVVQWQDIKIERMPETLPTTWNRYILPTYNCVANNIQVVRDLKVQTSQSFEIVTTEGITNIKEDSYSFQISPKVKDMLGASFSNSSAWKTTISTSTQKKLSSKEDIALEARDTIDVNSGKVRIYEYGDIQSVARLPLSGEVVIDGQSDETDKVRTI